MTRQTRQRWWIASLLAAPMAAVWSAPPLIGDGIVVAAPPRAETGPETAERRWTFADGRPALRFEWPAARPTDPPWALTLRPTRIRDGDGAGPDRSRIGLKLTLSKRF